MNDSTLVRKVQGLKGWSGAELAKEMGVTRCAVSNWRTGKVRMHKGNLAKLKDLAKGKLRTRVPREVHTNGTATTAEAWMQHFRRLVDIATGLTDEKLSTVVLIAERLK